MSQRLLKTEAWALGLIERVKAGKKVEDSRVELKRDWPDPQKGARRIAAHANASFGSDVLWIIGLDEVLGIVGVESPDLNNWWPSVRSHFDGVVPSLTDIILDVGGKSLVCLLIETARPPYVVKNPVYGSPGGGAVELEVPWREGTSVRSAKRNDLVRMLVPTIAQPAIEVLQGDGRLSVNYENFSRTQVVGVQLHFNLTVYLYPRGVGDVVIPFHKCQCILSDATGANSFDDFILSIHQPFSHPTLSNTPNSAMIKLTTSELIAHGPGKCLVGIDTLLQEEPQWLSDDNLSLRVILYVIDSELPVEVHVSLKPEEDARDAVKKWLVEGHG